MDLDYIVQTAKKAPIELRHHAAKEALQRCLLIALARQGLLADVSFIGGTALRLLHGLPRYSEDLDFIWTNRSSRQPLEKWPRTLQRALTSLGATGNLATKHLKQEDARVEKRLFVIHLVATSPAFHSFAQHGLQISLEVDLDPPDHTERLAKTLQIAGDQVTVPSLTLPSLMAGKLHILLTRTDREKGRDWFDYAWYRRGDVLPNVPQLQSAIEQTAFGPEARYWMSFLRQRIQTIEWENIRADGRSFLDNKDDVARLNAANLVGLTPYPAFAALTEEFRALKKHHPLLLSGNPVIADLQQAALEGDDNALTARFVMEGIASE